MERAIGIHAPQCRSQFFQLLHHSSTGMNPITVLADNTVIIPSIFYTDPIKRSGAQSGMESDNFHALFIPQEEEAKRK